MSKMWTAVVLAAMALPVAAQDQDCPSCPEQTFQIERVVTEFGGGTLLDLIEGSMFTGGPVVVWSGSDGVELPEGEIPAELLSKLEALPETIEMTLMDLLDSLEGGGVFNFSFEMEEGPESE